MQRHLLLDSSGWIHRDFTLTGALSLLWKSPTMLIGLAMDPERADSAGKTQAVCNNKGSWEIAMALAEVNFHLKLYCSLHPNLPFTNSLYAALQKLRSRKYTLPFEQHQG